MIEYKDPVAYLPHRPPMVLLEQVLSVTYRSARCQVTVSETGVLGPFLDADGDLPGFYALELISQTVGVWSGYQNELKGRQHVPLGMVLSVRDLNLETDCFRSGASLEISIESLMEDPTFGSCSGEIYSEGQRLCQGRVNVYQATAQQLEELFAR